VKNLYLKKGENLGTAEHFGALRKERKKGRERLKKRKGGAREIRRKNVHLSLTIESKRRGRELEEEQV